MAAPNSSGSSVNSQQASSASGRAGNNGGGDKASSSNSNNNNLKPPANKPPLGSASQSQQQSQQQQQQQITHVSESAMDFLLTEVLHWVESNCKKIAKEQNLAQSEESQILAAEISAARLERMGYSVGYRLCERLAQNKSIGSSSSQNQQQQTQQDASQAVAASQLEAVKFLCKEFWMEVFRKQIDKLQTNHRGVFVLKDLELKWLARLPANQETARVAAIQLLAFPCGLVRGALANLGIPAVVSCDFLADGQNMAACSFNIKIK
mmetsp:Transcript_18418/g.25970  ORF Transcript_18418/g.25970 Transcript_18418/m.25970 type:complete len:265 (+) Transcript_18418:81-875(+)